MVMKLYAHPDNYKTKKALIAARYVGLEVETPKASGAAQTGKIPVLETSQGCIFSSAAIARYIARISRPVGLYGQNLIDGGMIDSWIEFCTHELEVPLCTWVLPVMGLFQEVPEATACAKEDVKRALQVLDKHLLHNTYMVGHSITLADISLCCALVDGMQLVFDDNFRKPFGNVMRWFSLCISQPEFKAVLGDVKLCGGSGKGAKAEAAPKKEAAKKEAAPKKEAAAKKEAAPKKEAKKDDKKKDDKKAEKKDEKAEPTPEELEKKKKDKLKKVIKEGGKRGVEIEGAADMGGLQFFCTSVDEPEGDIELLQKSMEAMNAKSDPTEEERKGGSGHIGKVLFSAGVDQLSLIAYVPDEKLKELNCKEWLQAVLKNFGGEVLSESPSLCAGRVKTDADKGVFPLKIREPMILEANNFLRAKGLFPEDNGDSDDEFVFGDDDFPS
eukprot:TRINITY_DN1840_c1_g1_i1.p1 TRINITY_DN1840_c1_g1~~TRINITY_DN1840_c1_g1_i1.p1  ORF type:complete len:443 (-),score=162.92 TRINITY_DN1840_c1_g1_i1:167-1495(-)